LDLSVSISLAAFAISAMALVVPSSNSSNESDKTSDQQPKQEESSTTGDQVKEMSISGTVEPGNADSLTKVDQKKAPMNENDASIDRSSKREPNQRKQVEIDSLSSHFNRPEFEANGCSVIEGFIYQDSLVMAVIRLKSVGARGRIIGVYDKLLKRQLTSTLLKCKVDS
jgi:hypothetical protein